MKTNRFLLIILLLLLAASGAAGCSGVPGGNMPGPGPNNARPQFPETSFMPPPGEQSTLPQLSPSAAATPSPSMTPDQPTPTPSLPVPPSANVSPKPYKRPTRVPILAYHSVNNKPIGLKQLSVTEQDFEAQLKYLSEHGFTPISFGELKHFKDYQKPVILTFDDGYEDNCTKAYPLLKKYGVRATVFLVAGSVGTRGYLTPEQIYSMGDLVSFQSHTVNHLDLTNAGSKTVKRELEESRRRIAALTQSPVFVLSYPAGKYNDRVIQAASGLYDYAVTVNYGYYEMSSNPMEIRRLRILRSFSLRDFENAVGR